MADAWIKLCNEIDRLCELVLAGKLSYRDARVQYKLLKLKGAAYKEIGDIRRFIYPKGGRRFLNSMLAAQLYDETETVKLLPMHIESETVLCQQRDTEMTRGECFEYSGEAEHFEGCRGCTMGLVNKRLLSPPLTEV